MLFSNLTLVSLEQKLAQSLEKRIKYVNELLISNLTYFKKLSSPNDQNEPGV